MGNINQRRRLKVTVHRSQGKSPELMSDLRQMIRGARARAAAAVNAELSMLYWQVGDRIRREILDQRRAEYGKEIVHALSGQLTEEFGPGFTRTNLFNMLRFAETFRTRKIVHTLCGQLSWSHIRLLIYLDDPLRREFYSEMAKLEHWSVRALESRIRSMLFERTTVSRRPKEVIRNELKALKDESKLSSTLVFRDPYFLDFLGLRDAYSEKDLESAIAREIERFILELGSDFAFVAQKRITVDNEDYYLDLLFYHRRLRRLVAIDLKLGRFQAADKGQMELYLNWLDRHERHEAEESPIGLLLCAGKSDEHVQLLRMNEAESTSPNT